MIFLHIRKLGGPFIGGTDADKEGKWVWSDRTKMSYTKWKKDEPNNVRGEHCAVVYTRQNPNWNDIKCSVRQRFVCKRNFFHGHTYYFSSTKKTFDEAEADCVSMNGHLASIHSDTENEYLDREAMNR